MRGRKYKILAYIFGTGFYLLPILLVASIWINNSITMKLIKSDLIIIFFSGLLALMVEGD